jgi:hypothetical protein
MEDVRKMTIHRLTLTVTVIETTTIRIIQPGEWTDEATIDVVERPVVERVRRRGVRRAGSTSPRAARPSHASPGDCAAGPGRD